MFSIPNEALVSIESDSHRVCASCLIIVATINPAKKLREAMPFFLVVAPALYVLSTRRANQQQDATLAASCFLVFCGGVAIVIVIVRGTATTAFSDARATVEHWIRSPWIKDKVEATVKIGFILTF